MKENDYIKVTNRTNIRMAMHQAYDCIAGDEYGISEKDLNTLKLLLIEINEKLHDSIGDLEE